MQTKRSPRRLGWCIEARNELVPDSASCSERASMSVLRRTSLVARAETPSLAVPAIM